MGIKHMGIKRTFPIYETVKLQFEANLLNVANHPVFGSPSGSVNGSGFGLITSMAGLYNPRYAPLAARVNF